MVETKLYRLFHIPTASYCGGKIAREANYWEHLISECGYIELCRSGQYSEFFFRTYPGDGSIRINEWEFELIEVE